MPSHFSSIGFPLDSEEEMVDLAKKLLPESERRKVRGGTYCRWRGRSGEEVWFGLDRFRSLISIHPHFSRESRIQIGLSSKFPREDGSPLDGAMHGWAEPVDDQAESGACPVVFDVPDYMIHRKVLIPNIVEASICGFAHEIQSFKTEEDFDASQAACELKFAKQSFIPIGTFCEPESEDPPTAMALFTGEVLASEELVNEITGSPFFCASVRTLGGIYDIVVDPSLLPEKPQVDGIVTGTFWLSGRLKDPPQVRGGILRRLFS